MRGTIYIILIVVALLCIYLVSLPTVKEHFRIVGLKEQLTIVDSRFRDLDIREASSSYTEDKSIIYLCLRDERGEYYPDNTLMYVALHEIAHLLNKEDYGHTDAFHKVFDRLLCKAASRGVYDPEKPHASFYCGVDIRGISMPTCNLEDLDREEFEIPESLLSGENSAPTDDGQGFAPQPLGIIGAVGA